MEITDAREAQWQLRPEDFLTIYTHNSSQEMWSDYGKSKVGMKGDMTVARRLYPLLVHDIVGPINLHLIQQLAS